MVCSLSSGGGVEVGLDGADGGFPVAEVELGLAVGAVGGGDRDALGAGCAPEFGGGFPVLACIGAVGCVGVPGAPGEVAGCVGCDAVTEAGSPCLVAAGVEVFDGSEEGERFHAVVEGPHGGGAGVDDVFAASFADDARVEEHVCPGADAALRGDVGADFVQGCGGSGGGGRAGVGALRYPHRR